MRNCGNCINGYYNYADGVEDLLCGADKYFEKKVKSYECCQYHNFAIGCKEETNELYFDKSNVLNFVIVHKIKDKIDKILRLFKFKDEDGYYFEFDVDNYWYKNGNDFSFRSLDDEENGLFCIFSDFYNNLEELGKKHGIEFSSNRLAITIYFPDKLIVREDNIELFEIISQLYSELEMLCPPRLDNDENRILTLS